MRQRADDLERETAVELEQLFREVTELGEGEGEDAQPRSMQEDGDGDQFDLQSNWSYKPTEVYSTDDGHQERWSSPSPSLPLHVSSYPTFTR